MSVANELFLAVHIYSLYASGFLMLFYLFLTQQSFKNEFIFIRRIRLFLPTFYLFIAIMFFTGILLLAIKSFVLTPSVVLMLLSWVLILGLAIFHFLRFKRARRSHNYNTFKLLSLLILLVEIALLFVPYLYINFF